MSKKDSLLIFNDELAENGIKISLYLGIIRDFDNSIKNYDFDTYLGKELTCSLKQEYSLKTLKDQGIFAAYRSFYWDKLHIDPTKQRPAGEALVRRILNGKGLYRINYFVDGYNWASIASGVPISAYDLDKLKLPLIIRLARSGEKFHAIGNKVHEMKGNEVVVSDSNDNILTQFPFRDGKPTSIQKSTRNILVLVLGISRIDNGVLHDSFKNIISNLKQGMGKVDEERRIVLNIEDLGILKNF